MANFLDFFKSKVPNILLNAFNIFSEKLITRKMKLGRKAENIIARHLKEDGFTILSRNYTQKCGEIDIIAFKNGLIIFVEVRSRTGLNSPSPQDSVDYTKQQKILAAAYTYRAEKLKNRDLKMRFDVAAVIFDNNQQILSVEYFENAFTA